MTSQTVTCPDCGHQNPAAAEICESCNFPIAREAQALSAPPPSGAGPPREASGPPVEVPRMRRPRRRGAPLQGQALSLWLLFGSFAAGLVVYEAVKANLNRGQQVAQVEGSNEDQQKHADEARAALAKDSSNAEAHVELGNVLYDTANWSEAIVHYRAVVRRDSSRVPVLVDLGVCYYNLGDTDEAEKLFRLAIAREPHQSVALFNLGVLSEHREKYEDALQFYHRALQTAPEDEMKQAITVAVQRMAEKTGKRAGPLPGLGGNP